MKNIYILLLSLMLVACSSSSVKKESVNSREEQKAETVKLDDSVVEPQITVTGTKLSKEESQKLRSEPRLSMEFVKNETGSNIINAITTFKSLPQLREGIDCVKVLDMLNKASIQYEVVDSNTAVVKKEYGIYSYIFTDNSCSGAK
ncbi:hypothetical protein [Pseudoalteromonas luteoviolacea]|uniref:hypothetical protein n=1 Tax=Pseudoalteromonas luteoviolacea TaxID=43657 RepID=UPI0011532992|nr:hypothetical protein [Pseudoalteromonas luteoviolacea]TQF67875.1 hypothetical protein FLM44_22100 [Pseudoalteromonas luteoviolacea]